MKEQIKNNFKSKKGITLIALVVTIVVLLILAAVSIAMLGGENGIITQAQKSKEENKKGEATEEVYLYWNEAQINYNDTIEQKVEILKQKMQAKDSNATAKIEDGEIIVNYKGYEIIISYINKKIDEEVIYFSTILLDEQYTDRIAYVYMTKDSKFYVSNEGNKICINDKYSELSEEENIKILYVFGSLLQNGTYIFSSNKTCFALGFDDTNSKDILDLDNWSFQKAFDLRKIEDEEFRNKNLKFFVPGPPISYVLLDDGNLYEIVSENKLEKDEMINFPTDFEIKNLCINNNKLIILDQNGKMYDYQGENLSLSYANGFFEDKNIKLITTIEKRMNDITYIYYVFITEDKKMYIYNTTTHEIECLTDSLQILKDKNIINVYNVNSKKFNENYIAIVTDDGKLYYTEDMEKLYNLNIDGFPQLTVATD